MNKKLYLLKIAFCCLISLVLKINVQAQHDTIKWINFGPYTILDQNPNDNSDIPKAQINYLLDTLKPWVKGIRTFSALHPLDSVAYYAKDKKLNVILGIWINGKDTLPATIANNWDEIHNAISIANDTSLLNDSVISKIIVGSETLLRVHYGSFHDTLIKYITYVKNSCNGIPVSTADVYSELISHPSVVDTCDFIATNIYPFWERVPIKCAMQRFNQNYQSIKNAFPGKEIFISESGWKTSGGATGDAVPSLANAIRYNRELLGWSKANSTDVSIFSAFDEPWKGTDDGWGIFDSNAKMKLGMDTLFIPFNGIDTTWLCTALNNLSIDTLFVDSIPLMGFNSAIVGRVDHINPCDYKILTYINVKSYGLDRWWVKPYDNQKTVPILCNGKWRVFYTAYGNDLWATDMCMFLIPSSYVPPINGLNLPCIPPEVYQNAIDWECIHRDTLQVATLTASSDTICFGDTVTLTANTTSIGAHYLWNTGDTASSIIVTPGSGNTVYTVQISTGLGVGTFLTKSIYAIYPTLYINDHNIGKLCLGDTVSLIAYSYSAIHPLTGFLWSNSDTNDTIFVSPTSNTVYSVTATTAEGCTTVASRTVIIDINTLQIIATPDTIYYGNSAYLYIPISQNSYQWSTGGTGPGINVSPTVTTTYSLTFTDVYGCSFSLQAIVTVIDTTTTNIKYSILSQFSINPNPAQGFIQIKFPANYSKEMTISLINNIGQLLFQDNIKQFAKEGQVHYDIKNLARGLYYFNLTTEKEKITKKFIKE